jgi:hypothetical protein
VVFVADTTVDVDGDARKAARRRRRPAHVACCRAARRCTRRSWAGASPACSDHGDHRRHVCHPTRGRSTGYLSTGEHRDGRRHGMQGARRSSSVPRQPDERDRVVLAETVTPLRACGVPFSSPNR